MFGLSAVGRPFETTAPAILGEGAFGFIFFGKSRFCLSAIGPTNFVSSV
jgi:hypothetical protein